MALGDREFFICEDSSSIVLTLSHVSKNDPSDHTKIDSAQGMWLTAKKQLYLMQNLSEQQHVCSCTVFPSSGYITLFTSNYSRKHYRYKVALNSTGGSVTLLLHRDTKL
jgi:hypothetical protein